MELSKEWIDEFNKILGDTFQPDPQPFQSPRKDLQLAITLNPDLSKIEDCINKSTQHYANKVEELLKKKARRINTRQN